MQILHSYSVKLSAKNILETRLGCCQSKSCCGLSATTVVDYLRQCFHSSFISLC
jgi:hypothetical protein